MIIDFNKPKKIEFEDVVPTVRKLLSHDDYVERVERAMGPLDQTIRETLVRYRGNAEVVTFMLGLMLALPKKYER